MGDRSQCELLTMGISELEPYFGRRTILSFPLLPPPQKN